MDKVSLSGGRIAVAEDSELITHAGRPQLRHPQTDVNGLRKRQRCKIIAMGLNHQADSGAVRHIKRAPLYEIGIHRSVEPAVIHHVVHVTIGIVVHPSRGNGPPGTVIAAQMRTWFVHATLERQEVGKK